MAASKRPIGKSIFNAGEIAGPGLGGRGVWAGLADRFGTSHPCHQEPTSPFGFGGHLSPLRGVGWPYHPTP